MVQCINYVNSMASRTIGETVRSVLTVAQRSRRTILGFTEAINLLSKTPEEAEFCFLAVPKDGDSATHMHEVLLQAFCYEHGIYIIKVDDGQKLATVLGTNQTDECCVLVRKNVAPNKSERNTDDEDFLINFCEKCWDNSDQCVVKLPES